MMIQSVSRGLAIEPATAMRRFDRLRQFAPDATARKP
jgi:hypothetical protein